MKRVLFLLSLAIVIASNLFAQAPQGIPYQAAARNANGNILANQNISVRFTIHDSTANGTIAYNEIHSTATNGQGMFTLNIGMGTAVNGTFAGINWANNAKFMQVEMDVAGGSNFVDMGTQQMMSVPYALYAKDANHAKAADNGLPNNGNTGDMLYWNGSTWTSIIPGNYGQSLINCNGVPTWGGCLPIISTQNATNVTGDLANLYGTITNGGGTSITQKGFCWSTSQNPTLTDSFTNEGGGIGSFTSQLSGLTGNTTYYVRAYAINGAGTAYGNQIMFTTLPISLPLLNTIIAGFITTNSAQSGGNITFDGNGTITDKGICWSVNPNPTISDSHHSEGAGSMSFLYTTLYGLLPGITYYVRSYATNISGTAYGNQISFVTAPTIGQTYQGGIVFYILQPGDTNYNPNIVHGLIAGNGVIASSGLGCITFGCQGNSGFSTSVLLGSGQANTTSIVNGCNQSSFAAKLCNDLIQNGYSDWYLPSLNELLIYHSQHLFVSQNGSYFWSSSQSDGTHAWTLCFSSNLTYDGMSYDFLMSTGNGLNGNTCIGAIPIRSF